MRGEGGDRPAGGEREVGPEAVTLEVGAPPGAALDPERAGRAALASAAARPEGSEPGGGAAGGFAGDERFRLLSRLGQGGMGTVYEVHDRERNLRLALKELRQVTPAALLRFKDEFRALRDLRHPNLVLLDELFERGGHWFFTMELIDGCDFLAHVRPQEAGAGPASTAGSQGGRGSSSGAGAARARRHSLPTEPAGAQEPGAGGAGSVATDTAATMTLAPGSAAGAGGAAVVAPVAAAPGFDEPRLRGALAQLTRGVAALHRAGKVHRDLKPSNIMVDRAGRVVILDLGVAADLRQQLDTGSIVGTVPYMAPEQAAGDRVTPASDWYAVGVLLYRGLTGILPFSGPAADIIAHKLAGPPLAPTVFTRDLPPDLVALCLRLLARHPDQRPGPDEILSALGAAAERDWFTAGSLDGGGGPFVGREAELATLDRAYRDSCGGVARAVVVTGQSGVGKSATVAEFLTRVQASAAGQERRRPVLWRGRCHEREAVPFKAFDGVVDDLARFLLRRSPARRAELRPEHAEALVRLFPALGVVLGDAGAATGPVDAVELRAQAIAALGQLLSRVTQYRPLIIAIDDIQWADGDSLALLGELTGAAPCPPVLWLLTARDSDEARAALASVRLPLEKIELHGLPAAEARELAERLLGRSLGDPDSLARIVADTGGHPMFIDELVRQLLARGRSGEEEQLGLDGALRARIDRLGAAARELVAVVCVAGAPVPHQAVAEAGALTPEQYRRELDQLCAGRLLRTRGSRRFDTVEPYHDRVREAVYEALPAPRRAALHRALAAALEAAGAQADLLVRHFELGGDGARAAQYALRAAEAAAAVLAFERAAAFYRTALALDAIAPEQQAAVHEALGQVLQYAGQGQQAAAAYTQAALLAPPAQRLDLERRAAEQLLMGGQVRAGKQAAARVLQAVGMALPPTSLRTLVRVMVHLLRLRLHPLSWQPRGASDCPPESLVRADVGWSLGAGLSLVDTISGMLFSTTALLHSLPLGEPFRLARASCQVSVVASALELAGSSARLRDLAGRAAEVHGTPLARFYAEVCAMVHDFLVGQRWVQAEARARAALEHWRQADRGRGFESDFTSQFWTWSLAMQGQITAVRREVDLLVRDATRAGNRFMEVSLRVFHHLPYQAADRPEEGRREVQQAIASWLDEDAFQLPHCWALISLRSLALYAGWTEEQPEVLAGWRRLRRSVLRFVGYVRNQADWVDARWALHRAGARVAAGQPSEARRLRRLAGRLRIRLGRHRTPVTRLWGRLVEAGLLASSGADEPAIAVLEPLIDELEAAGSLLEAACARRRLGQLLGGTAGAEALRRADAWLAGQGVKEPLRLTAAIAPGWPE
jgi:hypothetical protein